MSDSYDSAADTLRHKLRVLQLMQAVVEDLLDRAVVHDDSKLKSPEKEIFDVFTATLRENEYGSVGYEQARAAMGEALMHHYAHNPHHPEYHERGIRGMSLLDVIEMLADWKAAGERHEPAGDLERSIQINRERFGYGDEFADLLLNTARELSWIGG